MYQGTTPSLVFIVKGENLSDKTVYLTIKNNGVTITKRNSDLVIVYDKTIGETEIVCRLTQKETLSLKDTAIVHIRYTDAYGHAWATEKGRFNVETSLNKDVLPFTGDPDGTPININNKKAIALTIKEQKIIEGVSPVVSFERTDDGALMTVKDITGTKQVTLYDGLQGIQGPKGDTGDQGPKGEPGSEYTVMVQEAQPTERLNKIWIPDPDGQIVEVPTMEELNAKADRNNTVLDGTLSHGRKADTYVGPGSIAYGTDVTASGLNSIAEGIRTVASHNCSRAAGYYSEASGYNSHAIGERVIANARHMYAIGICNKPADIYPEWVGKTQYEIGDRLLRDGYVQECIVENSDVYFIPSHWKRVGTSYNSDMAFVVGNGFSSASRSNAMEVHWDGTVRVQNALQIGDTIITEAQLQALLALLS